MTQTFDETYDPSTKWFDASGKLTADRDTVLNDLQKLLIDAGIPLNGEGTLIIPDRVIEALKITVPTNMFSSSSMMYIQTDFPKLQFISINEGRLRVIAGYNKFKPVGDRILVQPLERTNRAGHIIASEDGNDIKGHVLATGPNVKNTKAGEMIIYVKEAATVIHIDGERLITIPQTAVIGTIL